MSRFFPVLVFLLLSACSSYTVPRYSIDAESVAALRSGLAGKVRVGDFVQAVQIDDMCRGVGPIAPPDNLSFAGYIKRALESELKVAGIYSTSPSDPMIRGNLMNLNFSSTRGMTGGAWDIAIVVSSSNGQHSGFNEHYEFASGFDGWTACRQTADAFMPAVQNLVRTIVSSPDFRRLAN